MNTSLNESIKKGHSSVHSYISKGLLKYNEYNTLKQYVELINDNELLPLLKTSEKNIVNNFINNFNSELIKNTDSRILLKSLFDKKLINNFDIYKELVNREEIPISVLTSAIKKSNIYLDILKISSPKIINNFKDNAFKSLSSQNDFDIFYSLQTSGLYKNLITSPLNLRSSFNLWENNKDKIKECVLFIDSSLLYLLDSKKENTTIFKECLSEYVNQVVNHNHFIWPFINEITEYGKANILLSIKNDLSKLCKDYNLNNELSLINNFKIHQPIKPPCIK